MSTMEMSDYKKDSWVSKKVKLVNKMEMLVNKQGKLDYNQVKQDCILVKQVNTPGMPENNQVMQVNNQEKQGYILEKQDCILLKHKEILDCTLQQEMKIQFHHNNHQNHLENQEFEHHDQESYSIGNVEEKLVLHHNPVQQQVLFHEEFQLHLSTYQYSTINRMILFPKEVNLPT